MVYSTNLSNSSPSKLKNPPLMKPNSSPSSVLQQQSPLHLNLFNSVEQNPSSFPSSKSMDQTSDMQITVGEGDQTQKPKKIRFKFSGTAKGSDALNKYSVCQVNLSSSFEVVRGKRSGRVFRRNYSIPCCLRKSSSSEAAKKNSDSIVKKKGFCITLSQEEVEEDFFLIIGSKQLPKPKRLARKTHKAYLDSLIPGLEFSQK